MDALALLPTFNAVADTASFTAAARRLGLSRSAVSTQVAQLEQQLGVTLFNRTTRAVSLTGAGERLFAGAKELLLDLEALQSEVRAAEGRIAGHLKVELCESIADEFVIPRLAEFLAHNPKVSLRLSLSERWVDLAADGIDVALLVSKLEDSSFRYRKLGESRYVTAASPAYLARHGTPLHPSELAGHQLIDFFNEKTGKPYGWRYFDKASDEWIEVATDSQIIVNDTQAGLALCADGVGVYEDYDFVMAPLIRSGQLVRVLPDWPGESMPVVALFRPQKPTPPHLRVFLDFLQRCLAELPSRARLGAGPTPKLAGDRSPSQSGRP
jgi:LysR family transcriptional regulator for bpeEF and oprC